MAIQSDSVSVTSQRLAITVPDSLHPLELAASDALIQAVVRFQTLKQRQEFSAPFVDAIHRCQASLGSLRFWHTINQRYRRQNPPLNPHQVMTTKRRLSALKRWGRCFHDRAMRVATGPHREILAYLLDAYQAVI